MPPAAPIGRALGVGHTQGHETVQVGMSWGPKKTIGTKWYSESTVA